jgi:hypothetical protein
MSNPFTWLKETVLEVGACLSMPAHRLIVRIADFSMAVTVVDHVVACPPQFWGFMEAIFEVWGCSAGGVK